MALNVPYPVFVTVFVLVGLSQGLPKNNNLHTRQKRNNPQEHTNLVNVFLSELENNQNHKDVVFIMDRSSSVGHKIFYLNEKNLVSTLIRQYFAIKPGDFNVAVITFGRDVTTVIDHISRNTPDLLKCDFVEKSHILDRIHFEGGDQFDGGVNIRAAYQAAINILKNSKSPNNKQLVVVMTGAQYKVNIRLYAISLQLVRYKNVDLKLGSTFFIQLMGIHSPTQFSL